MRKLRDGRLTLNELKKILLDRVEDQDWEDNFYPTNLAKSIAISSNDLLKEFQWMDSVESWEPIINPTSKRRIKQKIGRIFFQLMLFSEVTEIEITHCLVEKKGLKL